MDVPETKYARSGDYHIAYQSLGDAPIDVVHLYGWLTHVEACWEFPRFAEYFRRIASFARLILFDKRGVGLSDPVAANNLPTLEEWIDDLLAVLDAVSSKRAAVVAWGDSGAVAMLAASTNPERISALVLEDSFARMRRAPDYPVGPPEHLVDMALKYVYDGWGSGATIDFAMVDKAAGSYLRNAMGPI